MSAKIADILITSERWRQIVNTLKSEAFPNPSRNGRSLFTRSVLKIAELEDRMRFENGSSIPYVVYGAHDNVKGQIVPKYDKSNKTEIPTKHANLEDVLENLVSYLFDATNNPSHPLTVPNVLPPTSIVSVLAIILAAKLNPNAIDEHYAGNVTKAELEVASMIVHLLPLGHEEYQWPKPWTPPPIDSLAHYQVDELPTTGDGSGGISTFGGTGCYMYAVKYALTSVANSVLSSMTDDEKRTIRATGINANNKFVILVSNQGHHCSNNVTDWLGIGYQQIVHVRTKPDNTMDLDDLKSKLKDCKTRGKVVVAVVPTFGTTDAGASDDVKSIREIVRTFDNIVDPVTNRRYAKPLIYVDSVIGWIWSFFVKYDFESNPLGFDENVKNRIEQNAKLAEGLATADAFGIDFHKTGYTPYAASMVIFKNYGHFIQTMKRESPSYLQQEQYDPGLYTLETSRSSMGYVSAWANFKHIGIDGLRSLTYNLIARTEVLREKLRRTGYIVLCNESNTSYSTLLRIYPFPYTPEQYERELTDETRYRWFAKVNEFQRHLYDKFLRDIRKNDGSAVLLSTPNVGLTTGFRCTYYNADGNRLDGNGHPLQGVFALKCYLNTPHIADEHLTIITEHFRRVRLETIIRVLSQSSSKRTVDRTELPKGVHKHHHLIAARPISKNFVLQKKFDRAADPEFKTYIGQLSKQRDDILSNISKLQKQLIDRSSN